MKPGMPPDDAELQALYRAAADEAPDAVLDARILDAARRAAEARRSPDRMLRTNWWRRWLVPVSVSAVAVLGVSLSLRVHEEQAAIEAAQMSGDASPIGRSASAPAEVQRADESPGDSPRQAAAQAGAQMAAGQAEKKMRQESSASLPPPAPAAPSAESQAVPTLTDRADNATKAAKASADTVPSPAAAEKSAAEADRPTARRPAADSLNRLSAPAPLRAEAERRLAIESSPERWRDEILALRQAGKLDEAARQLERLRQRYPNFALPAELR